MSTQMTSAMPRRAGETKAPQRQSEDDDRSDARLDLTGQNADEVWKACAEHGWFGADTLDYTFAPGSDRIPGRGA